MSQVSFGCGGVAGFVSQAGKHERKPFPLLSSSVHMHSTRRDRHALWVSFGRRRAHMPMTMRSVVPHRAFPESHVDQGGTRSGRSNDPGNSANTGLLPCRLPVSAPIDAGRRRELMPVRISGARKLPRTASIRRRHLPFPVAFPGRFRLAADGDSQPTSPMCAVTPSSGSRTVGTGPADVPETGSLVASGTTVTHPLVAAGACAVPVAPAAVRLSGAASTTCSAGVSSAVCCPAVRCPAVCCPIGAGPEAACPGPADRGSGMPRDEDTTSSTRRRNATTAAPTPP